jgi:hypothetical protein
MNGIAVSSTGELQVVGQTSDSFEGGTLIGWEDGYLLTLRSTGAFSSVVQFGSNLVTTGGLALDERDNIFVVGSTETSLNGSGWVGGTDGYVKKIAR